MVPTELVEELRGTWGPAPVDPEHRVQWEESMELMAQVPALLSEKIKNEGTLYPTLVRDFGSLEQLAIFEVECIGRFLTQRTLETIHDVVVEITEQAPWAQLFGSLSRVQKSRLRERLSEDLINNMTLILVSVCPTEVIRRLFRLH